MELKPLKIKKYDWTKSRSQAVIDELEAIACSVENGEISEKNIALYMSYRAQKLKSMLRVKSKPNENRK